MATRNKSARNGKNVPKTPEYYPGDNVTRVLLNALVVKYLRLLVDFLASNLTSQKKGKNPQIKLFKDLF